MKSGPDMLQQTADNADKVKEIDRRVQSLSGVLASPVSEDDYAEKGRRVELQRFVSALTFISLLIPLSGSLRGLLQSFNHSLRNMHSLGSYKMLIMPRP